MSFLLIDKVNIFIKLRRAYICIILKFNVKSYIKTSSDTHDFNVFNENKRIRTIYLFSIFY